MDIRLSSYLPSCLYAGDVQKKACQASLTVGIISTVAGVALLAVKADLLGLGAFSLAGLPIALPVGLCVVGSICLLAAAILFSRPSVKEVEPNQPQLFPTDDQEGLTSSVKEVEPNQPQLLPKEQYLASYQLNLQADGQEGSKLTLQPLDTKWRAERAKEYDLAEESSLDWENMYSGKLKQLNWQSEREWNSDTTTVKISLSKNCQKLDFMCYADRIVIYASPYGSESIYAVVAKENDPGACFSYTGFAIFRRTFNKLVKDPNKYMKFEVKEHQYLGKLYDEDTSLYNELTITIENEPYPEKFPFRS
jgi:hypothetical protein